MEDNLPGLRIELEFPVPERAVPQLLHQEALGNAGTMPNAAPPLDLGLVYGGHVTLAAELS